MDVAWMEILIGIVLGGAGGYMALSNKLTKLSTSMDFMKDSITELKESFSAQMQEMEARHKEEMNRFFDMYQETASKLLDEMPTAIGTELGKVLSKIKGL